jgi:ankyrin repeat protein
VLKSSSPPDDINDKDPKGRTTLMCAAELGEDTVVKTLIALKADVKAKDNKGLAAIAHAKLGKHQNIVAILKVAGETE